MSGPIANVIEYHKGGGWGNEQPADGHIAVRIIRGADFPDAALQSVSNCPVRFEPAERVRARQLRANDVVLEISGGTATRPTGRVVRVTSKMLADIKEPLIPASFCRLLRFSSELVDPGFAYYALLDLFESGGTWEFQNSSTGLSNFQYPLFSEKFRLPDVRRQEQGIIAEVLGVLDDKIAANAELIGACHRMSRLRFESMLTESPAKVPLTSLAQFINGGPFTNGASGTGRVVIRIAELNSGLGASTVRSDADVKDQNVARSGDILFAWSGSLTLHRWCADEAIINQHIFKVIPHEGQPKWLVYELLRARLPYFKDVAADKATTMGHIQRRHLDESVNVPASSAIEAENESMTALWDRSLSAELESAQLATFRNTLLPALMSGKLRVRDAEKAVEEVL